MPKPGRDTERFYRLAEGEKLKLLKRATLREALAAGDESRPKPMPRGDARPAAKERRLRRRRVACGAGRPPPAMEDWWLVRDSQGRHGLDASAG